MKKQLLLGLALFLLTQIGRADPIWGYDTRFSGRIFDFNHDLPDVPSDVLQRPLTQTDLADFVNCGDALEALTPVSQFRHPAPQFFYSIKDDKISVITPFYAGVDPLRCQTHTFGIKYRETEKVCYMAIPYRSPKRRPETWGYHYTASAIDLPGFTSDAFASGGPFQYFHQVNQQRDADDRNFADDLPKFRIHVTNFQNQRVIPFQMHPKAQDLWGPAFSADPELMTRFIRYLAQLASVATPEASMGMQPTIDQIEDGMIACERVSARMETKNFQKALSKVSQRMKTNIAAQREKNTDIRLEVRPLRKEISPDEILAVEAIITNSSNTDFETDLDGCRDPLWTVHPKGYFSGVKQAHSHCRGLNKGLKRPIGMGKNPTPSDNVLIVRPGVTRSFILYLPLNKTAKMGSLEFTLAFGRRNPIQSAPQKIAIVREGKD